MSSDRGSILVADADPELFVDEERDEELFKQSVLNASESVVLSEHHWFGDTISNILQLCRRASPIGVLNMVGNNSTIAFSLFSASPRIPRVGSLEPYDSRPAQTQQDTTNFALWFSSIFLTWRGEVTYHLLGSGSNIGASGAPNPTDELAVTLTNVDVWQTSNYPAPVLSEEPFINPTGSFQYPNGAFHKPDSLADQPAVASVPYYSEMTFQHTMDPGNFLAATATPTVATIVPYNKGSIPGVRAYVTSSAPLPALGNNHYVLDCLCNVSDNFSFGGLYPPPVFTDAYCLPATPVDSPSYLTANQCAGPTSWIITVP